MGYAEGNTQGYTVEDAVLDEQEFLKEAWDKAIDLTYLRNTKPKEYPKWTDLERLDSKMYPYGDWVLYVDKTTGIFYEKYISIGD